MPGRRSIGLYGVLAALGLALPATAQSASSSPVDPEDRVADVIPAAAPETRPVKLERIRPGQPIPPIVPEGTKVVASDPALAATARGFKREVGKVRYRYFRTRSDSDRSEGLERLSDFTHPASFLPMLEVLRREAEPIRRGVLDHIAAQGEQGQATLALIAIHDEEESVRREAAERLTRPASAPVLAVLDQSLRSPNDFVANHAGALAGSLNALETIPLLIQAQANNATVRGQGDQAWIMVGTQTVYVQGLEAVAGNSAAGFVPILGTITEGFVFRIRDAVVEIYRTGVHNSLVAMTSSDYGESTADLSYDPERWWAWYNDEYVPFKNEQAIRAQMLEPPPALPEE